MPGVNESPSARPGNIMIVDDNPANLKLLDDMLRQSGYEVRSFPRGRLALAAASHEPPDLILLDIDMPEMDGYEVCARMKRDSALSGVPVIFLTALNSIEDKVKGFEAGGLDYISKPFRFEEVHARLETHLKLRRAHQIEHELLERTLGGTVRLLWELLQLTSPTLAERSNAVRNIVQWITKQTAPKDAWQFELAASLCLLGCLAIPEDVFVQAYGRQKLSPDEIKMFQSHPENTAKLVSQIPRLEVVAEIIRGQQNDEKAGPEAGPVKYGSHMLHLALELDRRIYRGLEWNDALAELRASWRFDNRMLETLRSYSPRSADYEVRRLPIRELRSGMLLERDVISKTSGLLILKAGTALSEHWIERLKNFASSQGVQELMDVRVPRLPDGRGPQMWGDGASRAEWKQS